MFTKQHNQAQHARLVVMVLLFAFIQGCSSKYTVPSATYPQYQGEINQHTRLFKAERQRIFRILTDEKLFRSICPKGTIVTHESSSPYQKGLRINTEINHIFNLKWQSQVVEVVPDKKIRLQFINGFFAGGTEIWELESKGEFTQTTQTIIVQVDGFLKKMAWYLKVRRKHDKMVEAFLDNLKSLSEK